MKFVFLAAIAAIVFVVIAAIARRGGDEDEAIV